jgi:polyisoprenoid-binding protein YceI
MPRTGDNAAPAPPPNDTDMKNAILLALALALLHGGAALAATTTYVIDPQHSFARFEYDHWGYTRTGGRFDTTAGTITIDPANKSGAVDVVIDARSVSAGSDEFNEHLRSADFFDTAHYPTITFKSSHFKFDGDKLASVDGDLTVKGVTRPVTLVLSSFLCKPHPMFKKDYCGASASTTILRSQFNAGKYAPFVADEVTLAISLEAAKQ